jgi:hypothetical protein
MHLLEKETTSGLANGGKSMPRLRTGHLRARRLLVVAGIALSAVLMLQTAANAHDVTANGPYDCGPFHLTLCSRGSVTRIHTEVTACDLYADGRGAFTLYWLYDGFQGRVRDGNGSASGCGDSIVTGTDNPVWYIQSCIDGGSPAIYCGAKIPA